MADNLDWETAATALKQWIRSGSGLDASHVFWAYEGAPRPTAPYIEMSVQQVRGVGHDWHTYADNPFEFVTLTVSGVTGSNLTITGHPFATGDGPVHLSSSGTLPAPLAPATDYWVIVVDPNTIQLAASYTATGGQQPLGGGNPQTPITLTSSGSGTITVDPTVDTVQAGKELTSAAQGFREVVIRLDCYAVEGQGYTAVRLLSNVIAALELNLYTLDQAGVGVSDLGQAFAQGGVQFVEGRRGGILEPRAMVDVTFYMASSLVGYETIITQISGNVEVTREDGTTHLPNIPFSISES